MIALLWILAIVLTVLGLAGLVLPALPGAPLLFVGLLLAAWAEDFVYVGGWTLAALGVMAVLTYRGFHSERNEGGSITWGLPNKKP